MFEHVEPLGALHTAVKGFDEAQTIALGNVNTGRWSDISGSMSAVRYAASRSVTSMQ